MNFVKRRRALKKSERVNEFFRMRELQRVKVPIDLQKQFCNVALCWISGKIIESNLSYVFSHVHLCIIVRAGRGSKSTAKECDFPQRLIARQFSGLIPVIPFW